MDAWERSMGFLNILRSRFTWQQIVVSLGSALLLSSVLLLFLGGVLAFFITPTDPYFLYKNEQWSRGVIVDLGSSASRISLYQWVRKSKHEIEIPVQPSPLGKFSYWEFDSRPGFSSYGTDLDGAVTSLQSLFGFALEKLNSVQAVSHRKLTSFLV